MSFPCSLKRTLMLLREPKKLSFKKKNVYRERGKEIKIKMLKMPLTKARRNRRTALGLLVFCLISEVQAHSLMETASLGSPTADKASRPPERPTMQNIKMRCSDYT